MTDPDDDYREYVREQVHELTRTLTRVKFGDFECGASTTQPDELFGYLASMINVSINAARNAQSELQASNRKLESRNRLLHAVLEGTNEIVFLKDRDGRYVLINRPGCEFFGLPAERIVGKSDAELLPEHAAERVRTQDQRIMTSNVGETYEIAFDLTLIPEQQASGNRVFLATKTPHRDPEGAVIGLIGLCRDITDRVEAERRRLELEDQLRHAQKMEAVGQLAGGIAHDFNNLLTSVLGNAELLLEDTESGETREIVEQIAQAGRRAAELTEQLLTFSRKRVNTPDEVHLGRVLLAMEKMLRRLIGDKTELSIDVKTGTPWVLIDPVQLEQVIINLVLNSRDAMPEGGLISIALTTPTHELVRLRISDTGTGMEDSVRERVFEPFFTTKEVGKGTGLGLSTAYGIVNEANGKISVTSQPGVGTQFTIDLPRTMVTAVPPNNAPEGFPSTVGTVLLVEDCLEIRQLTARILKKHGFSTIVARDSAHARDLIDAETSIDLLITDVVMPEHRGNELAQRLIDRSPEARVLLISGFAPSSSIHELLQHPNVAYLRKPFGPTQLFKAVGALTRPAPLS